MVQTSQTLVKDNPGYFRNTNLLSTTTSIDSLSPSAPIFPVMRRSPRATWTKYHNIVGLLPKTGMLARFSGVGDGVVSFSSAHLEDVESEMVVQADHVAVHTHPRSILGSAEKFCWNTCRMLMPAPRPPVPNRPAFSFNSRSAVRTPQGPRPHPPPHHDSQVVPANHAAPATPVKPAVPTSCQCDGCRHKEFPKFDYGGLSGGRQ